MENIKKMNNVVFTNGVFDGGLNIGHVNLLLLCRKLVGVDGQVIVAIDSDAKVIRDKGPSRPIFSINERQQALLALKNGLDPIVDVVYGFDTNDQLYELIKQIKPDLLVKGNDWKGNVVGSDIVKKVIYHEYDSRFTTTNVVQRILDKNSNKVI